MRMPATPDVGPDTVTVRSTALWEGCLKSQGLGPSNTMIWPVFFSKQSPRGFAKLAVPLGPSRISLGDTDNG
jgi:hypothetical protein